jgi:hypothetical protein
MRLARHYFHACPAHWTYISSRFFSPPTLVARPLKITVMWHDILFMEVDANGMSFVDP